MKTTASRQRGLSDFHFHYTAIRHQLKIALISICILSLLVAFLLNLLAGRLLW